MTSREKFFSQYQCSHIFSFFQLFFPPSLPYSLQEVIEKPKTSGRVKQTLDSNFFFRDPARRGGRGRSSGGRPRGEGRGEGRRYRGDRRDRAPNVEDKYDFPTLTPSAPTSSEVEQ